MRQRNYTSKMTRGFYVIVFAFIPAILANIPDVNEKLGSNRKNYNICLTETNVSDNDIYTVGDILFDRYKQSENQEKLRKNACFVHCIMQKEEVIGESEFNVEKIRAELTRTRNVQPGDDLYKAMDDCLENVKDVADICEKSFDSMTCYLKAERNVMQRRQHEKHDHE